RVEIASAGTTWANAPMMHGIQSTDGYNPLRFAMYDRAREGRTNDIFLRNHLGVKFIASAKALAEIIPSVEENALPLVFENDGMKVWDAGTPLPRVLIATSAYLETNLDRAVDKGKIAPIDYRSMVVLDHLPETLPKAQSQDGVV